MPKVTYADLARSEWLRGYNLKHIGVLVVMFLITLFMWNTVLVHPFKVFVVMMHELCHGLAAVLTGGRVTRIQINPDLGGVAYTLGGNRSVILLSGYLGSMVIGAAILIVSSRTKWDKPIAIIIGLTLLWVSIRYVTNSYGQTFGIIGGVFLTGLGIAGPHAIVELLLQYIGLTSVLYAPLDIYDDTVRRNIPSSDAEQFALLWGLNGTFWGILWTALSVLIAFWALRWAIRHPPKREATHLSAAELRKLG